MTERENERNSPGGRKMKTRMQGRGLTGAIKRYISHENNGRGKSRVIRNYV